MIYFDTVTYSALANGEKGIVNLIENKHQIAIPLNVIAELRYGFIKGSQKDRNEKNLQRFLAQPQIQIVFPTIATTHIYADLQLHCTKEAKVLSHNDLWIAALAKENKGQLVTYDQDFEVLRQKLNNELVILTYSI